MRDGDRTWRRFRVGLPLRCFIEPSPLTSLLYTLLDGQKAKRGPTSPGFHHSAFHGVFVAWVVEHNLETIAVIIPAALDFTPSGGNVGFAQVNHPDGARTSFSGNIASVSRVLSQVTEIGFTQEQRGAAMVQTVRYQMAR